MSVDRLSQILRLFTHRFLLRTEEADVACVPVYSASAPESESELESESLDEDDEESELSEPREIPLRSIFSIIATTSGRSFRRMPSQCLENFERPRRVFGQTRGRLVSEQKF